MDAYAWIEPVADPVICECWSGPFLLRAAAALLYIVLKAIVVSRHSGCCENLAFTRVVIYVSLSKNMRPYRFGLFKKHHKWKKVAILGECIAQQIALARLYL